MKYFFITALISVVVSCKLQPNSNRNYASKNEVYKLSLKPPIGSKYYFDVSSDYGFKMKLNDTKTENNNKTNFGAFYQINKDTAGNWLLNISYDKIHVYTKNGDVESELDAANAKTSINPLEKMLGLLTDAKITAIINSKGEPKSITGYQELGERIIANFNPTDENAKNVARQQWEKIIGQGIVKKNLEDFFKIFPDSAVHIGDNWRMNYQQSNEIPLIIKTTYTLKDINNDIAIIESEGVVTADTTSSELLKYSSASVDLKGKQEGQYEMDAKTGVLINCSIKTNVEGKIEVMSKEVPISIKTSLKMSGKKIS